MEPIRSAAEIELVLSERLGVKVHVSMGRSRTQPVRATRDGDAWSMRLHRMFAQAPRPILADLASWLKSGRRARAACARLDAWIDQSLAEIPPAPARAPVLHPRGRCYDLGELAERITRTELAGEFGPEAPLPRLTWGRRSRSSSRRSLRLGSFEPTARLVRLHPVQDQPGVPEWFVRFVLFHELLHAVHPPAKDAGGRWIHHGSDFRRREQAHPDYSRALSWEQRNLPALIRSARTGIPLPTPREAPPGQGLLFSPTDGPK